MRDAHHLCTAGQRPSHSHMWFYQHELTDAIEACLYSTGVQCLLHAFAESQPILEACLLDDAVLVEEEALAVQRSDELEALEPSVTLPGKPLSPGITLPRWFSQRITVQQRTVGCVAENLQHRLPHRCPGHSTPTLHRASQRISFTKASTPRNSRSVGLVFR